jgi:hypothetical protein
MNKGEVTEVRTEVVSGLYPQLDRPLTSGLSSQGMDMNMIMQRFASDIKHGPAHPHHRFF